MLDFPGYPLPKLNFVILNNFLDDYLAYRGKGGGLGGYVFDRPDPIAVLESALAALQASLAADLAARDLTKAANRLMDGQSALTTTLAGKKSETAQQRGADRLADGQSPLATVLGAKKSETAPRLDPDRPMDEPSAGATALDARHGETAQWLDSVNDRAARQREAERVDRAVNDAFGAVEQLRTAIGNYIAAMACLGPSGAAAAADAADFREMMRESAAEALQVEEQRKREILESIDEL